MKRPILANEETIAALIVELQEHEEQLHDLKIQLATLSGVLSHFAKLPAPEFDRLSKTYRAAARRLIPAAQSNVMEDKIRGTLQHLAEQDRIRKKKPN